MASKWIEHIKSFAKANGMSYKDALKCPKCKSSYHEGKGKGVEESSGSENIKMEISEKKSRGRPPKYSSPEERKKAKSVKTMESNKRKKKPQKEESSESASPSGEESVEGKGFKVGYKTENDNGLGHIYPISHQLVLQMLSR